jgi:hypothetical protein
VSSNDHPADNGRVWAAGRRDSLELGSTGRERGGGTVSHNMLHKCKCRQKVSVGHAKCDKARGRNSEQRHLCRNERLVKGKQVRPGTARLAEDDGLVIRKVPCVNLANWLFGYHIRYQSVPPVQTETDQLMSAA